MDQNNQNNQNNVPAGGPPDNSPTPSPQPQSQPQPESQPPTQQPQNAPNQPLNNDQPPQPQPNTMQGGQDPQTQNNAQLTPQPQQFQGAQQQPGPSTAPNPSAPGAAPNNALGQTKPSPILGILGVVFSVVFAPVGFVLGIIALLKGIKSKYTLLTVLGVSSIVLSIITTVVLFSLVININRVDYSDTTTYTRDINDYTFSFEHPEAIEEQSEDGHLIDMVGEDLHRSAIIYGVFSYPQGYFSEIGDDKGSVITAIQTLYSHQEQRDKFAEEMSEVAPSIDSIELERPYIEDERMIMDFSASGTVDEDDKFKGVEVTVFNDALTKEANVIIYAEESIWEQHQDDLMSIVSTITIE